MSKKFKSDAQKSIEGAAIIGAASLVSAVFTIGGLYAIARIVLYLIHLTS